MPRLVRSVLVLGLLGASASIAEVFRYASSSDLISFDPHSVEEQLTISFKQNIYEGLVRFDANLELEPALAVRWKNIDPLTWRFDLRQGVTFHDGTPFTADDVVFSFARQKSKTSGTIAYLASIRSVRKTDDFTIEYVTHGPDPTLLRNLVSHYIMSRKWCEAHGTTDPVLGMNQETYATRHENGTGPFTVVERLPDTRTVLVPYRNWWDTPRRQFNIARAEFRPIPNPATRLAALISGEVDLAYPVAPQDVPRVEGQRGLRVVKLPEMRVIYLGLDVFRAESLDIPGSGKNPLRDVRVRRALYEAIDVEAIRAKVMRGLAIPTGSILAEGVEGYDPTLRTRLPFDPAGSRRLLTEAGYPDGFPVTLDCPNDRYINDEAICQSLVPMLSRIGLKVTLNSQTKSKHFDKVLKHNSSLHMLGYGTATQDALATFLALVTSKVEGSGVWNAGRYSNPRVDELVQKARVETDSGKRHSLLVEIQRVYKEDLAHIPLHQQMVLWGVRDGVEVNPDPRDMVLLRFVSVRR